MVSQGAEVRLASVKTQNFSKKIRQLWPYLSSIFVIVILKLPTLDNTIIFIDEPLYLAQAQRLNTFYKFIYPYNYRNEPKFQIALLPDILALAIDHDHAILILRLFGLLAVAIAACILISLSKTLFNNAVFPGLFAIILWSLFLNDTQMTIVPLIEYFQAPFLFAALLFFVKALQHLAKSRNLLIVSGLFLGVSFLIKQPAGLVLGVTLLFLLCYALIFKEISLQTALKYGVLHLTAFFVPMIILLSPYLFALENLPELKFSMFDLLRIYSSYSGEDTPLLMRITVLLILLGVPNAVFFLGSSLVYILEMIRFREIRRSKTSFMFLFLFLIIWALLVGYGAGLMKTHYLVPIFPLVLMFVGAKLNEIQMKFKITRKWFLLCVLLIFLAMQYKEINNYLTFAKHHDFYATHLKSVDQKAVVAYIKANSTPQDSIWVYYEAPEFYWEANRYPATNDPTVSYLTAIYTPFWFNRTQIQLARDNPLLIIAFSDSGFHKTKIAELMDVPQVSDYIKQNYLCSSTLIENTLVCKRNH